jgi:GNAT superfamily N-acetyltransferase
MVAARMDPSLRIRRGTADDIPIIVHHRLGMMAEMGIGTPAAHFVYGREFADFVSRTMESGHYHQWLAETDIGQIVSGGAVYIVLWPGNPADRLQKRAFIINVYTEPAYRKRGIARSLVETMAAWCRGQGFHSVRLHASDMGRPLYEAIGFQPTHEMRLSLD